MNRAELATALAALPHDDMVGAICDALNLRADTAYVGRSGIDSWAGPDLGEEMSMHITINLEDGAA